MNLTNYIEFFKITFDESTQVVFLFDPTTNLILACNKMGLNFYGYTFDEITKIPISKINDVPVDIIKKRMKDTLKGSINKFEFIHKKKNNQLIRAEVNASKVILEGNPYLLVIADELEGSSSINIEDKEYSLLDAIINSTNTGMMLIEKATHIIKYVNNAALSLMKANSTDVIGMTCNRFVCPAEENCCPLSDLCQQISNDEKELIRLDGSKIPILKSVNTITINYVEYLVESFVDISERKKYQNKLKESESNFRTFFESIDDIILIADLDGFIISHNQTLTAKLGYDKDEVVGKHILDLRQPEKAEEVKQILDDIFAGILNYCQLPLMKKDGSLLPVETRAWRGKWNGKECLYGISKDISKQQSALQKFERVFKNNPAIMALINYENGEYIDINDSYTRILGFTKEEIIGRTGEEISFLKINDDRAKILQKFDEDGKFSNIIMQVYDKNGNIKYGNFSGEIIDNQSEKILLTVMVDVTEELNQKQEIESFFSVSLDLLCIIDIDGKLLKVNEAWENLLNIPSDKIVNTYLANYVFVDDLERYYNALTLLKSGETLLSYINRLQSDAMDGEHYFEWRAILLGNKIYAAGRDINDRIIREAEAKDLLEQVIESRDMIEVALFQKNALIEEIELSKKKQEESIDEKNSLIIQLEETKRLLELNIEEKEKFFSIIAHDLRSPFSGFLGLTKILSEEFFNLSMREMQEFAHSLKLSADNLYKLLENLLEWSRVKRGLVGFSPHSIKLNNIFNTNIDLVRSKASLKNITLNNYIKDYINVNADENMLNAIVRNLISNALKFTPHNGTIVFDAMADIHQVLISVQDSGIGMPPEIQNKLFTIGEKVSRSGTDGEPSTGLGLALCKEYIDLHHGKIWVESKLNQGSTFYFTLKIK